MKKTYQEIIEDVTVDCYSEYEQISGWVCLLDDEIATPCKCKIGTQNAYLEKIDSDDNGNCVIGVIRIGGQKLRALFEDIIIENDDAMNYVNAYRWWCKNDL